MSGPMGATAPGGTPQLLLTLKFKGKIHSNLRLHYTIRNNLTKLNLTGLITLTLELVATATTTMTA
jgi:hypothetical protein